MHATGMEHVVALSCFRFPRAARDGGKGNRERSGEFRRRGPRTCRGSAPTVTLSDAEGERICIRSPISARKVSKLLQVFSDAGSPVVFSAEHEFLLALDAKDETLGGLYFHFSDPQTVYMDRVVVARAHHSRGVSDALMGEFKRRLKVRGAKVLETGLLCPEYTMRFGFRTGPRHGGLFVPLDGQSTRT